jgi:hypothetical protein
MARGGRGYLPQKCMNGSPISFGLRISWREVVRYYPKNVEKQPNLFWIKDIQKCYVARSTLKDDDHLN